jgi:hypothetical protein
MNVQWQPDDGSMTAGKSNTSDNACTIEQHEIE